MLSLNHYTKDSTEAALHHSMNCMLKAQSAAVHLICLLKML
uniref:Uncharacterized protein n=1 Tax=Anguilla anguilla TaxID=7936 RepID=A0A0E9S478_ANGAN